MSTDTDQTMTGSGSSNYPLEIVVINLERSVDRREHMRRQLAPLGLPYSFFPAVDGKLGHPLIEEHYSPKLAEIRRGVQLSAGELGCFASHYLLWERCVQTGKAIVVLEDDAILTSGFTEALNALNIWIGKLKFIRLSAHAPVGFTHCATLANGNAIVRFSAPPLGTSGYCVSPDAAAIFLKAAKIWYEPVDNHIDRFWTHGVQSYGLHPQPVSHASPEEIPSQIWLDGEHAAKSNRYRRRRSLYKKRERWLRRWANWRQKLAGNRLFRC